MMFTCPVCGRLKCAYWPEHWVYRRGQTFYCSENCMIVDQTRDLKLMNYVAIDRRLRKGENNMKNNKLTLEQKKKAVEIFQSGGDHLAWLKKCGAKNPSAAWVYIKQKMEVKNPNLAEKTDKVPDPVGGGEWEKMPAEEPVSAGQAMQNMQDAADKFFGQCRSAGLKIPEEGGELPAEEQGLKVKSVFSNVIKGGFFAKGERGVPMSIRTYPTMTLVAKSNPFDLDNQLKDCKLELTKDEWLKLVDEIREALDKMEI